MIKNTTKMKKPAFYKTGIGHPFKQTDDNNVIYTNQPLHLHEPGHKYEEQKFKDQNRGDKVDGEFQTFTDPKTGKKASINLNRSYATAQAIDEREGNVPPGLKPAEYKIFAQASKKNFHDTGKWLKWGDYSGGRDANTDAGVIDNGNGSGNGTGTPETKVEVTDNGNGNGNGTETPETIVEKEEIVPPETPGDETPDTSAEKGYIRDYVKGEGFQGEVLDREVVGQMGRKELNAYARAQKKKALSLGATRREARAHKMDIKALGHYASAGETLKERDAQGNIVRESDTEGLGVGRQQNMAGKARKKGAKFTRRANRLRHRMKDHEGHNLRENEIGGQYYGDTAKFNQNPNFGAHDQRNAQARAAGGSATMNSNTVSSNENSADASLATEADVVNPSSIVSNKKKKKKTSEASVNESIKNIGVLTR